MKIYFHQSLTAKLLLILVELFSGEDGKMQSLYNGLPLRGGERVLLKIPAGNSKNNEGLDFSKESK